MTLEELTAVVSELKGQIIDLSKEKEKVIGNRDEILAEKRAQKAELDALKAQIEDLKKQTAPGEKPRGDDDGGRKTVSTLQAELDALKKQLDDERSAAAARDIDSAVIAEMEKQGIKGRLGKAALAYLKANGDEFAKGADGVTLNGLPLADAIKKGVDGGDLKDFILAPASSGATPQAHNGSPVPQKSRSEMSDAEKGEFVRKHGVAAFKQLPD